MPMFVVNTNVCSNLIPPNFTIACARLVAEILEKPVEKVIAIIHPDQCMIFGGSNDNCATITLHSLGKISPGENKRYAKAIGEFFEHNLKIPQDRCYIDFHDQDGDMLGVLGTTRSAL